MKKIYTLTAILLFFIASNVNAQIKYGASAGLTHSSWNGAAVGNFNDLLDFSNGMITTQPKIGIFAGGFTEIPLGGSFSIQPGIFYSQKGYSLKEQLQTDKFDFLAAKARANITSHYIDIPLVLKAEIARGLQIYAGPQLSYLVKSNLKMDAGLLGVSLFQTNMDVTNNFNKTDFAITGGASYTFDNGFSVNAGYDRGLSKMDKNSNLRSYNSTFKVGLGYKF